MKTIYRIFVEKHPGYDNKALNLLYEINNFLGLKTIQKIRLFNRYDIQGVGAAMYRMARDTIFSDPVQDIVFEENMPHVTGSVKFGVEYLPGQFDQRSDSAAQCIQILTHDEAPLVRSAKIYMLIGKPTQKDIDQVRSYLINPVDSRLAEDVKPATLTQKISLAKKVKRLTGFTGLNPGKLSGLCEQLGLAMSLDDLIYCQDYFKNTERRDPSITEIKLLDTYWSDHCRHTTFNTQLDSIRFDDDAQLLQKCHTFYKQYRDEFYGPQDARPDCLMDLATMAMKALRKNGGLKELDISEEVNACSIHVPVPTDEGVEDWLVMFKNETHNHPTEIEPFGGAATCLGGAIRDPLSGRAYVYQAMRVTGSGDPRTPIGQTRAGKLSQRTITTRAAKGYSSYGNQIGLATGLVSEIYHDGYVAKRLEIGAVVGAVKADRVVRQTPQKGDIVVLLGGRTGKDGIGGATGSSKAHTQKALDKSAEVQKGNPPTERKLQRLFTDPEVTRMIIRANDFGAGGVAVAVGELCDGLDINLDKVPKKYEGLDGTELAISESQERMAVVIHPRDLARLCQKALNENVEAVAIARVTESARLKMFWENDCIVDIDRNFLNTNGIRPSQDVQIVSPNLQGYFRQPVLPLKSSSLKIQWKQLLGDINVASQMGLQQQFDSSIGARTVLQPFGGINGDSPIDCMVARLPFVESSMATAMSWGFDPYLGQCSPFHAGLFAVIQSVTKLVAAGVDYKKIYMSFQEYFEKLGDDPLRWGKPYAALLGAFKAQMQLMIAAIGGKDSMSGTFEDISVPPTLVAFSISPVDSDDVVSTEFKAAGHKVICVYVPLNADDIPDFNLLKDMYDQIRVLMLQKKIFAARAVGRYGIADALAKMCFGNRIGIDIDDTGRFFLPDYTAIILETDAEGERLLHAGRLHYHLIGTTTANPVVSIKGSGTIAIEELYAEWQKPLEEIFPNHHTGTKECALTGLDFPGRFSINVNKSPRVSIPVFPGTNCEFDVSAAFQRAGAAVEGFVFKNLSPKMIDASLTAWAKEIDRSNILVIPGGFSAGDEPDGSGKFIAAVLRNPLVRDAVMRLLTKRDGLVLGICNGFQALIRVGLLPYGEIMETLPIDAPTLTFNKLNRHYARPVHTRVISRLSPWFLKTQQGAVHTVPISNGEGRIEGSLDVLHKLNTQGQIATQYVDGSGAPSMEWQFNPSGSKLAIESISSADGRILGKMAHSERIGKWIDKNIPGNKDQKLFESGVSYFSGKLL